ncbi:Uncharacterised protein [Vibrio cholerae]|nr:Uncharacterised protein [Vibrio cholerae]
MAPSFGIDKPPVATTSDAHSISPMVVCRVKPCSVWAMALIST